MSKEELPEPWRSALEPKGIHSIRGLATKAHISPMAASRLVKGQGTSVETVNAVAWFVFDDIEPEFVWRLHGLNIKDYGTFTLPAESSLLSEDQRAAVLAVVRAMLPPEVKKAGGASGNKRDAPANQNPAPSPGEQLGKTPLSEDASTLPAAADESPIEGSGENSI